MEKTLEETDFGKNTSLNETKIDDEHDELESLIGPERTDILDMLRGIYNWSILSRLLKDSKYISQAKVRQYNQHKQDLKLLKHLFKNLDDGKMYDGVFRSGEPGSSASYSGNIKSLKGGMKENFKSSTQEDFCAYLKKILDKRWDEISAMDAMKGCEKGLDDMRARIEDGSFMPLQSSKDNSVLPNAVHRAECKAILENMSRFYPFLLDADEKGVSVSEKILDLCTFRMPYYIGPVGPNSKTGWIVKRTDEAVRPWNYKEVIDVEKTSERFIGKLIGFCSYLIGERVMPKQSIAYCRFKLYDELNNLKINGKRIEPEMKESLIHEYFEGEGKNQRITPKTIQDFYRKHTGISDVHVEGMDLYIKSNLESENKMKRILAENYSTDLAEELIRIITIYGDDRSRLKNQLETRYGKELSPDKILKLTNLRFKDWGNLSEKFLKGICAEVNGNSMCILSALEKTNLNHMELLSQEYGYKDRINEYNQNMAGEENAEHILERVRCSPSVKHSVKRCIAVMDDILKITGHPPSKIFIETTREHQESKRTTSRRSELLDRYASLTANEDAKELLSSLESSDDARLRGKKLFSYYSQLGKCMYCGKHIDLNDLGNSDHCDMDHIYPQSKVTDDSLRNNMVLTCRTCNGDKRNIYPIRPEIRNKMSGFWKMLKDAKLITDEKYGRLTRSTEFTDKDLSGFINRQLVETSQTVRAMAEILKFKFGEQSDIVYVKGKNVSQFRQDNSEKKPYYIKCRNINDYHHAKDAYLNIVVGNVYDVKFTKDIMHFVKSKDNYNLNKMFEHDVARNGTCAWIAGETGSIATVDKWMRRDNILYTRAPYTESGELFDLTIMKAGKGQWPVKTGMDIDKYGGYNKLKGSYFSVFEHDDGKKRSRTIVFIPRIVADRNNTSSDLEEYASKYAGLKNPSLRYKCIKVDSRLEIDGFKVNIRGTSGGGSGILYLCGEQLSVPFELLRPFKNIFKFTDKTNSGRNRKYSAEEMELTEENTIQMFNFLSEKLSKTPYNCLSPLKTAKNNLDGCRDKIIGSNLNDRADTISQILKMFRCNAENANLKDVGGPGVTGRLILSSKITLSKSAYLVNQSPTGLFENRIDLLKI